MTDATDLEKLKTDLKKTQDDIVNVNQKAAGLQGNIKTLETKLAEIEKATAGYDTSAVDMQRELDEDERAIGKKRTIAEAAINELKELVARKILDFDEALADAVKGRHRSLSG